MKTHQLILLLLSFPTLALGWLLGIAGIYYFGATLFGYPTNEENVSLATIWAFSFAFGAISISGVLAGKTKFANSIYIQKVYKYSMIISASFFLGYMVVGILQGFIGLLVGE